MLLFTSNYRRITLDERGRRRCEVMGDTPLISMGAMRKSLDETAREHYVEKFKLCGGVEPLFLGMDELHFDVERVPRVKISHIKDFLGLLS